jgi:hypothetical protein
MEIYTEMKRDCQNKTPHAMFLSVKMLKPYLCSFLFLPAIAKNMNETKYIKPTFLQPQFY